MTLEKRESRMVLSWEGSHIRIPPMEEEKFTLPETNIAPENGWLEYYFPIGEAYFQVLC